jgi:hypothetical protein
LHEQQRGTRQQRGYDRDYDRTRRKLEPIVKAGRAKCWRCGNPIQTGTRWNLGHDDTDRTIIRGAEHERCNLSAAGKASHPDPA